MDLDQYENVRMELDEGLLTLTLCNPDRRNALTADMYDAMRYVWNDADNDDEVRVIVLQGDPAGRAFCSGLDVSIMDDRNEGRSQSAPGTKGTRSIFWNMVDCEKPIISKVRGVAYGLGVNIALLADIVVAERGARFCDSHVNVGVVPGDGGVPIFTHLLGFHKAKEYLMLGKPMIAEEAERCGLINHAVPADELDGFTQELVAALMKQPPLAVKWTKMSVNTMLKQAMAGAFEMSLGYDMLSLKTDDHKEATSAFMEKRPGAYRGA